MTGRQCLTGRTTGRGGTPRDGDGLAAPSKSAARKEVSPVRNRKKRRLQFAVARRLWGLEVANVLARAEAAGLVSEARSETFLGMLHKLNISVDPSTATHALATTLQLARRHKLSAYDAAYLELALRNGLPLATLDAKLLKAARKSDVNIFVVKPG